MMFDLDTKFTVAPEHIAQMEHYLLFAPGANKLLEDMQNGIITEPTPVLHVVFTEVMHSMPKFREPIPGLRQTEMRFDRYEYLSETHDDDAWPAEEIGWRYVMTTDGTLGIACKPDATTEPSLIAHFITWEPAKFDGR